MDHDRFDQDFWERLWSKTVREHPDKIARHPPNAQLVAEVGELDTGRSLAEAAGADVAGRIAWVEGDLATWTGAPESYDLVVCLYVHIAGPVEEMVGRMASCVAPGGTLFMVGHRPIDPVTGAATAAAGQVQVSVEPALAVLGKDEWEVVVAEDRPRRVAGSGVDAVIRARRHPLARRPPAA
jgi:hypothetical protein